MMTHLVEREGNTLLGPDLPRTAALSRWLELERYVCQ
jgi:hypothetical protein